MPSKLLTIEEAAERTRLPINTLRWMRHKGTGPRGAVLSRRIVYREDDLEAWIEQRFADDEALRSA